MKYSQFVHDGLLPEKAAPRKYVKNQQKKYTYNEQQC